MTTPAKAPLIEARDLRVTFEIRRPSDLPWTTPPKLRAVNGVSFTLEEGKTLGIVGESGCGKSTLARALIRMLPAEGEVIWEGKTDLLKLSPRQMLKHRADIQMIFQDPLAALDPRMTVGEIIAEPLRTHRPRMGARARKEKVREMMEKVGLLPNQINRYPHEFSGGQCQRIGIARALVVEPKLLICDEPVSALDVSIQAQVIALLEDLRRELGLTIVFIAHDLSVVRHVCDEVLVLYLGQMMETGESKALFRQPEHPYTQALLSAVPIPDPKVERSKTLITLEGDLPSPLNPPSGCPLRTRCGRATEVCAQTPPVRHRAASTVVCHHPGPAEALQDVLAEG
ncbi:oligopeptide/dipeptide ABC transporter ATP-binding protein [Acidimangrovimonas sediminis]|uniref:oligopeptide/dipeptide ABC transporter ATP-binding protein n=1 Tax=Acidimangrovimonas sediminis TaxID=2056283 RepID=UPI000C80779D|nr:oligopeptide/dipeptide ABC transporter ATP-binding protein [Acidimangrovimonas sediminis]